MADTGMACLACNGKCPNGIVTCERCQYMVYCSEECRIRHSATHASQCRPPTPPQQLARKAVQYLSSTPLMHTFQVLCYGLRRRSEDGARMTYVQLLVIGEPWESRLANGESDKGNFFLAHTTTVSTEEYLKRVHDGLSTVNLVGKVDPELIPVVSIQVPVHSRDPNKPNRLWQTFFYIWAPNCPHPAGMYPERIGVDPTVVTPEQTAYLKYCRERALSVISTSGVTEEEFLGGRKALAFSMGSTREGRPEIDLSSITVSNVGPQAERRGLRSWMFEL